MIGEGKIVVLNQNRKLQGERMKFCLRQRGNTGCMTLIYQLMAVIPRKLMINITNNWDLGARGVSDGN